jgi:PAS domain S-box-containing protein
MDRLSFQHHLRRTLIFPTTVLIALCAVLVLEMQHLVRAMEWVDHTDRVIAESRHNFRLILDQETGLRGFLITGGPEYLQPFRSARSEYPEASRSFDEMISDNAQQQRLSREIDRLYASWVTNADSLIADKQARMNFDFSPRIERARGVMEAIRHLESAFSSEEQRLRDQRVESANVVTRVAYISVFGLGALLTVLLIFSTRRQLLELSESYGDALKAARLREEELRRSREWMSTTMRSIGDGVIATGPDGNVLFMNNVAEELTGWREEDARGRRLEEVFVVVDGDSRMPISDALDEIRHADRPVRMASNAMLLGKQGRELVISDSGAPIRNSQGLIGVVIVFRDVTEQTKIEQALRANEKLAVAGRLSASISHEINNPLDAVNNTLYLLANSQPLNEQGRELVNNASAEVARIVQITRNMLSLYRESNRPIPIKMQDVLDGVLTLAEKRIREKNIRVQKRYQFENTIEAFPGELRQVFSNLITNAVDAMSPGGTLEICGKPWTEKRMDQVDDYFPLGAKGVEVIISDTGPGIPQEALANLFRPFFTTKGEKGTGLGLWVSKGIVEKHGGHISVHSKTSTTDHGTSFVVDLPAKAVIPSVPVRPSVRAS